MIGGKKGTMFSHVLKLPHYTARDGGLYFLGDRIRELSAEAVSLHQALPHSLSAADELPPLALLELVKARAVFICDPPQKPPANAPRLVVISPHMDDAIFSVGGLLLRLASIYRIHIISLFSIDPYTTLRKLKTDLSWLQILRNLEESCATSVIHATTVQMAWKDALLRSYQEITDQIHRDEPLVYYTNELSTQFQHNPDLVLCPVGITHVDHRLTRMLIEQLKQTKVLNNTPVFYYEDLPYASGQTLDYPDNVQSIAVLLTDDELILKKKLVKTYLTQMNPGLMGNILHHKQGQERLWCYIDDKVSNAYMQKSFQAGR
jgi:hypothetical protein